MQLIQDKSQPIEQIMLLDFATVHPQTHIVDVFTIVNNGCLSSIPVVSDGKTLDGLITKSSLLTTVTQQYVDTDDEQEESI